MPRALAAPRPPNVARSRCEIRFTPCRACEPARYRALDIAPSIDPSTGFIVEESSSCCAVNSVGVGMVGVEAICRRVLLELPTPPDRPQACTSQLISPPMCHLCSFAKSDRQAHGVLVRKPRAPPAVSSERQDACLPLHSHPVRRDGLPAQLPLGLARRGYAQSFASTPKMSFTAPSAAQGKPAAPLARCSGPIFPRLSPPARAVVIRGFSLLDRLPLSRSLTTR
jgi:hypothetical protein